MSLRQLALRLWLGGYRRVRERMVRKGYQPNRFWDVWGHTFHLEEYQRRILPQHEWLRTRLSRVEPASVLEVGCGFGRNLHYLRERAGLTVPLFGCDLSRSMLQRAVKGEGVPAGSVVQADAGALPYADREFSAVFTMGLCMHVPPSRIRDVLGELIRVSGGDLLLVEQWLGGRTGPINEYTFAHDYPALLRELGARVLDRTEVQNQERLLCLHARAD